MSIRFLSRLILPAIAAGLLIFAIMTSFRPALGRADPLIAPPTAPFATNVAGVGVVEPESEMIAVASDLPGVVRDVFVKPGDDVAKGAPLFRLDDRAQRASLEQAQAALSSAKAAARVAEVALDDETERLKLFESVSDQRAVSVDELERRRFAVAKASASLAQSRAEVETGEAQISVIRTEIDRLTVAAPITGRIFSVDARPGEFAAAGALETPLMTIGAAETLHLRVEIDETDFDRVQSAAPARASVRGRSTVQYALTFVRFEPRAVEKKALAGGSERVDSRVVEVIYALEPDTRVIVGQRMDVYIDAAPSAREQASL